MGAVPNLHFRNAPFRSLYLAPPLRDATEKPLRATKRSPPPAVEVPDQPDALDRAARSAPLLRRELPIEDLPREVGDGDVEQIPRRDCGPVLGTSFADAMLRAPLHPPGPDELILDKYPASSGFPVW